MTALEIYNLLNDVGVDFEVIEVFEGARLIRVDVYEDEPEETYDAWGVNTKNSFNTEPEGTRTMKTQTINLYTFEELSDDAKENARNWFKNNHDYGWHSESRDSVTAFCDHFGVTVKDWSLDPFCPYDYEIDAENYHFRGRKLRQFKRDHMPTGYCLDCDPWMTFYDEFKKTGDAKRSFDKALDAGFKAWRADIEYYIDESIIVNEYQFTESGEFCEV
jgi:hypothetical protein